MRRCRARWIGWATQGQRAGSAIRVQILLGSSKRVDSSLADDPGRHPAYLHALTDLRHARAHLENLAPTHHMDKEEEHAIDEIDKAIEEIKRAAIDDGKNLNDHPPVDARCV